MIYTQQRITKTEAIANNGMVTAMHPLAAESGVKILQAGGNAADAAIATALAAGVVEPFMSGIGGCAYAVAYDSSKKQTECYDGSGITPGLALPNMFTLEENRISSEGLYGWPKTKDDAAETGFLSIAVPGSVAALGKLHENAGSMPWRELFKPAIELASEGYPVDDYFFVNTSASLKRLAPFQNTLSTFFGSGNTAQMPSMNPNIPNLVKQPDLSKTLETLAEEGPNSFYSGSIAKTITSYVCQHGGILQNNDLENYCAKVISPLQCFYRGHRIMTLPDASGGPTVVSTLSLLAGFEVPQIKHEAISSQHIIAEALRLAFNDRFHFLGDQDSTPIPFNSLLSEEYLSERRKLIAPSGPAITALTTGNPSNHANSTLINNPGSGDASGQHTTHINVIDSNRNMVALTATLGARFGSGVTIPDLGIVLNNGMMWYNPEPGNLSSISSNKRALHAAAPCLVFDENGPRAAIGSPGGRKIMSAVVQVLSNLIDSEMSIQDAIAAPRIHRENDFPVHVDALFPRSVSMNLLNQGHEIIVEKETFINSHFGRPSGITINSETQCLHGGVEIYRPSVAIGY